jgi:hypothetical protein
VADTPLEGRTVLAHVDQLLLDAADIIGRTLYAVRSPKRMKAAQREQLRRELAGVIGNCETVRIWLDAGAPR